MTQRRPRADFPQRFSAFVDTLRLEIQKGKRRAGDMLDPEQELAKRYQLSLGSIRKGLKQLADEGLIEKVHGRGSVVTLHTMGSPDGVSDPLIVATYSPAYEEPWLRTRLESYVAAHPGRSIQVIRLSRPGYVESLSDLAASGRGPDVVLIPDQEFPVLSERLQLLDLDKSTPGLRKGEQYPQVIRTFTSASRQLVAPVFFSPLVLAYNQDLFDRAGIAYPDSTWTWNTVEEAARALTHRTSAGITEQYGFGLSLERNRWPAILMQHGVRFTPPFEGLLDRLQTAVTMAHRFLFRDSISPLSDPAQGAAIERLFEECRVAMILTSYQWLNSIAKAEFSWDISVTPKGTSRATMLLCAGLGVTAASPKRDEALHLIQYMLTRESQEALQRQSCTIPALRSVSDDSLNLRDDRHPQSYHVFREMMRYAYPSVRLGSDDVYDRVNRELELVWTNLMSPEDGCRRAVEHALADTEQQAGKPA